MSELPPPGSKGKGWPPLEFISTTKMPAVDHLLSTRRKVAGHPPKPVTRKRQVEDLLLSPRESILGDYSKPCHQGEVDE